jgi:hypothetical protein
MLLIETDCARAATHARTKIERFEGSNEIAGDFLLVQAASQMSGGHD